MKQFLEVSAWLMVAVASSGFLPCLGILRCRASKVFWELTGVSKVPQWVISHLPLSQMWRALAIAGWVKEK